MALPTTSRPACPGGTTNDGTSGGSGLDRAPERGTPGLLDRGSALARDPVADRAQRPVRRLEHRDVPDVVRLLVTPPGQPAGDAARTLDRDQPVAIALQEQDRLANARQQAQE